MTLNESLRAEAIRAPESGIVAVVNHGRSVPGLIPLWAGESDLPTPAFISDAAARALAAGETFYTWQRGIPELREGLARYHARHFGRTFAADEFIVTCGGMHAITMAIDAVAGAGDEVIYLTPSWPNFPAALGVAGGRPVPVQLRQSGNGWACDIDAMERAVTPSTRALFVNTPSNPTGWTADRETLSAILALARRHGLWIIADEIYALFHFGGERAASFMDIAEPEDRILYVNTFSKNWAMTGWRIGWLRIHPSLGQVFENLVQYSTSGVPAFLQRGALAALEEGDGFLAEQVERAGRARDLIAGRLAATGRVRAAAPAGAFYHFFEVEGIDDTRAAAFRIVDEARVGLAPGTAFGPGGDRFFRACFHRRLDLVEEAADRLARWIEAN
jgi:aspartate/methionine/tyrosine aminotransferase